MEDTDVIVLWGSNARETHPIFFHHVLKAVHKGARLYAVDPRRTSSAEWADVWLGLDVGSDIALANAVDAQQASTSRSTAPGGAALNASRVSAMPSIQSARQYDLVAAYRMNHR